MADLLERLKAALSDRYAIERELGTGGMATVYLAEDLKHDRKVALKVLKPELAAVLGGERFLQEIKTTASLQHPHILPLFDSGESDGLLYYVMPYVEGETLRDKLDRERQLPVEEAVRLTMQVADALDYAHRQGVIHRDIKPENVLLHDGRPMVADFGIALAVSAAAGGRMTETGLSLGTPHYMSPEQATAERDLTSRSDIYSLGAMLYEMLTGDPPHTGSSAQQIIMKIVTEEAEPVTKTRKSVPPNVAAAVAKSLEKLPADRFGSAKLLGAALGDSAFSHAQPADHGRLGARSNVVLVRALYALIATSFVLLVAALVGWLRSPSGADDRLVRRLTVQLPDSAPLALGTGRPAVAITADGSRVAYVARISGEHFVAIYDLVADGVSLVPGSAGGTGVIVARDGSIGFFNRHRLYRTTPEGTGKRLLASFTPVTRGAVWLTDSTVVATVSPNSGMLVAPSLDVDPWVTDSTAATAWPALVPGSDLLLFVVPDGDDPDGWQIVGRTLSSGTERVIVEGGSHPSYVDGHVIFLRQGGLWAVGFDAVGSQVRGEPVLVQPNVLSEPDGLAHYAVSEEGTLIYAAGGDWRGERRVVWVSRDGSIEPSEIPIGAYMGLALSPDNSQVALTRRVGSNDDRQQR
jgi:serine/threonine-protein kinase